LGFFDDLRSPWGDARDEEEEEYEAPEWLEAPGNWLGGVVPVQALIARSEAAAIYLSRIVAYPVGFEFTLDALTRNRQRGYAFDPMGWEGASPDIGEGLPEGLLRFGVEFADGRKARSAGGVAFGATESVLAIDDDEEKRRDAAAEIFLTPGGGGGSDRHAERTCWVWPLPPQGTVAFVCEWPRFEIPESRLELDAQLIRGAADRAVEVWPSSEGSRENGGAA
jgi:hypothetical protein